jgi:hypothetical protein
VPFLDCAYLGREQTLISEVCHHKLEDCIHSKHYNDDGGVLQRELQTSYSPHENCVWHTIQNAVTKKTDKHTEFNNKETKKIKLNPFKANSSRKYGCAQSCHTLPQHALRQTIALL